MDDRNDVPWSAGHRARRRGRFATRSLDVDDGWHGDDDLVLIRGVVAPEHGDDEEEHGRDD